MTDTDLTPNAELAWRVLDQIDAHPESWNQFTWWCGTGGCFAGWAVALAGCTINAEKVVEGPVQVLGMSVSDAAEELLRVPGWTDDELDDDLFEGYNTREDLGRIVANLFGPRPAGGDL